MTYFMLLLVKLYPGGQEQALWAQMFSFQLGTCFGLLAEALLLLHFTEAQSVLLLGFITLVSLIPILHY